MYPFDEQNNNGISYDGSAPSGFTGGTDRVNGEYHYKNGRTEKLYSDARYAPYDDSPEVPKYYTPKVKAAKEAPEEDDTPEEGRKHFSFVTVLAMCLVCAVLGGIGGAFLMSERFEGRISSVETAVTEVSETQTELKDSLTAPELLPERGTGVTATIADGRQASDIYTAACSQVVGISTDVTYTNFFGQTSSSAVSGTGFFVSDDGYILTNYHVIEYAYNYKYAVTVILHDGTRYDAAIVGVEECNDLAVLKINASGITAATLGNSDEIHVGDTVYAVGNPLGELDFTMTTGHVSALDRYITTDESDSPINMFQFDAAVNSGNSGGPLYDEQGRVVGIVTAKYKQSGVEGIGFAIPSNDAAAIAEDLITKGYVTGKAYLGVELDQRYTSVYSKYYGLPEGAYVYYVEKRSAAETAGVLAGDIITGIDGSVILTYSDLSESLRKYSAGETAELTVYRAGNYKTLQVTFDEQTPSSGSSRNVSY